MKSTNIETGKSGKCYWSNYFKMYGEEKLAFIIKQPFFFSIFYFYLCTFWFPSTTPKVTRKYTDTTIDSRHKSQPSTEQNQGSRNFFFFFPSAELNPMFGTMVYASSSKFKARTILFFRRILDFEYLKRIVISNTMGKETRLAASPTKTSFSVRSTSPKDTWSESLKKCKLIKLF